MVEDLSQHHRLLTDLFQVPQSEEEWDRYRLSDEQVQFYREQGYLPNVRLLTEEQVEALRTQLTPLFDPRHPGHDLFHEYHSNESGVEDQVLFHALGAWRVQPAFHDLLWNPAFTMPASQLLGGAVRFWHDQLFCKPARHGGVVAWHQDYSYWTRTQPMNHLTCWIALDDSTIDNGAIHYVPGSHRWDLLPITGLAGDMEAIKTILTPEQLAAFKPVAVEVKKGYGTFHHPLMIHGSYANRTERPRRAAVLNAFRDGTHSVSDKPLLRGVPVVSNGATMGGLFFPLLFDPATV